MPSAGRAAFCAPSPTTWRTRIRTATSPRRPRMCATPSGPGTKAELDELFSAVLAPVPIPSSKGSSQLVQAEAAYREAKAAYRALKGGAAYREAKAAYKAAKAAYKEMKKRGGQRLEVIQNPVQGGGIAISERPVTTVAVCGGKSCARLGSGVVAALLARKGLAPKGYVPDAKCMKLCGGVGPTMSVDGKVVKVDLEQAVMGVVEGERNAHQESRNVCGEGDVGLAFGEISG